MRRRGLCAVVAYLWRVEGHPEARVSAERYWPLHPGTEVIDGKEFVVIAEYFQSNSEPTHELLACGDIRAMPMFRKRPYYNRSRRCPCSMT